MTQQIHPTAIIEAGAQLGVGVVIGPYCVIGGKVKIGDHTHLASHVVVSGRTKIGEGCRIHAFASLGGAPQHAKYAGEDVSLEIGARNTIREYVSMNAGTPMGGGRTIIGNDGFFMTGCHVGHDCNIGNEVVLTNNALIAGHVEMGRGVIFGGGAAVHQRVRIGEFAMVGGLTGLENDLIPYGLCTGDRAELSGLNLIGLKRRGFSREIIHALRRAYRELFAQQGTLEERVSKVAAEFAASAEVMNIVAFVRAGGHRALCTPRRRGRAVEA